MPTRSNLARAALSVGGIELRPATLEDVSWVVWLQTARTPDEPGNQRTMRYAWKLTDPGRVDDRWVVQAGGTAIGYAALRHAAWDVAASRSAQVIARFPADAARRERIQRTLEVLEPYAFSDGAAMLTTSVREDFDDEYTAFVAHGYREARRSKSWELDLAASRPRIAAMATATRRRMREAGFEITTIDRMADPDRWRKLHAMCEESVQDVPTTVPHAPDSFESFMQWMSSPGVHADRLWVAREGSAIVGISLLDYPPGVGNVWTDYTGTARSVRGRGVARALKCETVLQAIDLGVTRVRTNNDGENAPILHLNEEMGYTRIPGQIQLLKSAPGAR